MARPPRHDPLVTARTIARTKATRKQHRINPRGIRHQIDLGGKVGMQTMGAYLVTIAPGDQTTEFHTHFVEEEFLYILSGHGVAEIGDRRVAVGPGDFLGFKAGSVPHAMANPHAEPLVYLMSGTRQPFDVVDYPRAGIRSYKFGDQRDDTRSKHRSGTRRR